MAGAPTSTSLWKRHFNPRLPLIIPFTVSIRCSYPLSTCPGTGSHGTNLWHKNPYGINFPSFWEKPMAETVLVVQSNLSHNVPALIEAATSTASSPSITSSTAMTGRTTGLSRSQGLSQTASRATLRPLAPSRSFPTSSPRIIQPME
jgi:hypothetical protein